MPRRGFGISLPESPPATAPGARSCRVSTSVTESSFFPPRGCTTRRGRTLRTGSLALFFFLILQNLATLWPGAGFVAVLAAQAFPRRAPRPRRGARAELTPSKNCFFPTTFGCGKGHRAVSASRSTRRQDEPAHAALPPHPGGLGRAGAVGNVCKFLCRTHRWPGFPQPRHPASRHQPRRWPRTGAGPARDQGAPSRRAAPPEARSFVYGYFPFPAFNVKDKETRDETRESGGNLVPARPRSHRRQRLPLPGATAGKLRLASKLPSLCSRANTPHLHFIVIFCLREMLRYYRTG